MTAKEHLIYACDLMFDQPMKCEKNAYILYRKRYEGNPVSEVLERIDRLTGEVIMMESS